MTKVPLSQYPNPLPEERVDGHPKWNKTQRALTFNGRSEQRPKRPSSINWASDICKLSLETEESKPAMSMDDNQEDISTEHPKSIKGRAHRLRNITAGDGSVQLLVSTENPYDVKNVKIGKDGWQVIGTLPESSILKLAAFLSNF